MTIKEIEQLSGMTRANIRYYETEGLLTPIRAENGYRDYSPEDLRTLQRIRLLRAMGMSLEDIKAVQSGRMTLSASLYDLEQELSGAQERLDWARETCRILRQDNVTYETLDANQYFTRRLSVPTADQAQVPLRKPWRRFFARVLDAQLYHTILVGAAVMLFRIRPQLVSDLNILWTILGILCMGLVEPILLRHFGTTPGKWFLGLSVTDLDGYYPDLQTARARTWGVLWWGQGLSIPIFTYVRYWKSYHSCLDGEYLLWEDETVQTMDGQKRWKDICAGVLYGLLVAALFVALLAADTVPNKGDLTKAQFCENYNAMTTYYGVKYDYLQTDGSFTNARYGNDTSVGVIRISETSEHVEFVEEDGALKSVKLIVSAENTLLGDEGTKITCMTLAAVKSRVGSLSNKGERFVKQMLLEPFGDYTGTVKGIAVTRDWEYTGYTENGSYLVGTEDGASAKMVLTIAFE